VDRRAGLGAGPQVSGSKKAAQGCPCGHLGDSRKRCRCTPRLIQRYRAKISGPLLDRIDLHIEVPPVATPDLLDAGDGEGSAKVAGRVERARHLQLMRFQGRDGLYANGQMGARGVYRFCRADDTSLSLLRAAMARFSLSARSYHRVLKLARTIADLRESDIIRPAHVAEAIQYGGAIKASFIFAGLSAAHLREDATPLCYGAAISFRPRHSAEALETPSWWLRAGHGECDRVQSHPPPERREPAGRAQADPRLPARSTGAR
jgi:hypothetical protein